MNMKAILGGKKWGGTMLVGVVALMNDIHGLGISETMMIWVIKLIMVFVLAEAFIDAAHAFASAFGEKREKVKTSGGGTPPSPSTPAGPGGGG